MATKYAGRDFWLEVYFNGIWMPVQGERASAGKLNNEQVDVTEKGDVPWRQLLQCGIRSDELTISGVMRDNIDKSLWNWMMQSVMTGSVIQARMISNENTVIFYGPYLVASLNRNGDYNKAEEYSITFASAGANGISIQAGSWINYPGSVLAEWNLASTWTRNSVPPSANNPAVYVYAGSVQDTSGVVDHASQSIIIAPGGTLNIGPFDITSGPFDTRTKWNLTNITFMDGGALQLGQLSWSNGTYTSPKWLIASTNIGARVNAAVNPSRNTVMHADIVPQADGARLEFWMTGPVVGQVGSVFHYSNNTPINYNTTLYIRNKMDLVNGGVTQYLLTLYNINVADGKTLTMDGNICTMVIALGTPFVVAGTAYFGGHSQNGWVSYHSIATKPTGGGTIQISAPTNLNNIGNVMAGWGDSILPIQVWMDPASGYGGSLSFPQQANGNGGTEDTSMSFIGYEYLQLSATWYPLYTYIFTSVIITGVLPGMKAQGGIYISNGNAATTTNHIWQFRNWTWNISVTNVNLFTLTKNITLRIDNLIEGAACGDWYMRGENATSILEFTLETVFHHNLVLGNNSSNGCTLKVNVSLTVKYLKLWNVVIAPGTYTAGVLANTTGGGTITVTG